MIYAHTTPAHLQRLMRKLPAPRPELPKTSPKPTSTQRLRLRKCLIPKEKGGSGRGRNRTCDFHRVKMALWRLSPDVS